MVVLRVLWRDEWYGFRMNVQRDPIYQNIDLHKTSACLYHVYQNRTKQKSKLTTQNAITREFQNFKDNLPSNISTTKMSPPAIIHYTFLSTACGRLRAANFLATENIPQIEKGIGKIILHEQIFFNIRFIKPNQKMAQGLALLLLYIG